MKLRIYPSSIIKILSPFLEQNLLIIALRSIKNEENLERMDKNKSLTSIKEKN